VAYGVPDPTAWTYFQADPEQVMRAARHVLSADGFTIEGVEALRGGGYLLTVTGPASLAGDPIVPNDAPPRIDPDSAKEALAGPGVRLVSEQLLIVPVAEQDYRARAQVAHRDLRLRYDLERALRQRF
jgi:hypothetical protein